MVAGKAAVHFFSAEVVDEHNVSVPLSELYVHHWLIFNNKKNGADSRGRCCHTPSHPARLCR